MSSRASRTVYVGNLPGDIREREVEDLFRKYGPIAHIDLKIPPRPPGYAFVEFEDARDAEDAIHGRDGYDFDGHRLRVELAHGGRGHSSSSDRHSNFGGGGGGGRGGSRGVSRHSEYRVLVSGLPSSASWQDLKDHMRRGGDVCFSQVFRDSNGTTGVVDYTNYEDMKYAIKKLDDSEFRNAFSRSYIRVKEYDSKRESSRSPRGRSYSRSPSRSRSRSRSVSKSPKTKSTRRSPARSRSPSRSRSKSPSLSGSRSRSRSPLPSREKQLSKSPKKRSASRSPSRSRSRSRSKSLSRYILNWLIHSQVNADALRTSVDPSKVPPCRCQSTKTYSFSLALFRICQSLPHKSQFAEFGDPEYPCGPTELEVADDTLHDAPGINMLRTRIANKMARDHNMPEIS